MGAINSISFIRQPFSNVAHKNTDTLNVHIQARVLFNGLEKQILEKMLPSQSTLEELPQYYKSIIERVRKKVIRGFLE